MNYDSTANEYLKMINPIGWRRDLDIRPLAIFAGLSCQHLLEVYSSSPSDYYQPFKDKGDEIHTVLQIPNDSDVESLKSLHHYTTDEGHQEINKSLWDNYIHGTDIPANVNHHVENIKSILNKTTNEPTTLFTGVNISPATLAGMEWNSSRPKKLITFPAFTSTSTDMFIAHAFADRDMISTHHESDHHGEIKAESRHILQLEFPNGVHHAASTVNHSNHDIEKEVLLTPGHSFELHPRPTKIIHPNSRDPYYVWKAVAHHEMYPPMIRDLKTK